MNRTGFLIEARVDDAALQTWIEAGWLVPREAREPSEFSDTDVARAQLIRDLRDDLGVNDDGVAVVLDLVDQIYGLRATLRTLLACLNAQPEAVRERIGAAMRDAAVE